jgi:hypothetical protein
MKPGPTPKPALSREEYLAQQRERMAACRAAEREELAMNGRFGTVDRSTGAIVGLRENAFAEEIGK